MATIRQVVDKAVELKAEQEKLEALLLDRQRAQQRFQDADATITAQQTVVNGLMNDLKMLING